MLVVWSFWSKPFEFQQRLVWPSEQYHLMAWSLSVQTARQHYPRTALITDDDGARLLVDHLQLPFDSVSTELNCLKHHSPDLWALGKLYAYRAQTEPFIHLDSDVFLWKPLPKQVEDARLCAQNPEHFTIGQSHYKPEIFSESTSRGEAVWLPHEWVWYFGDGRGIRRGDACGIFGGNAVDFIRYFAALAIRLVEHPGNAPTWARLMERTHVNNACGLFEEFLLASCIEYHRLTDNSCYNNVSIEYLFTSMEDAFNEASAAVVGYTHLLGGAKTNSYYRDRLRQRVERDLPELYERCIVGRPTCGSGPRTMSKKWQANIDGLPARVVATTEDISAVGPKVVFVELTQHCNLKCSMCRSKNATYRHNVMSDAVFHRFCENVLPCAEIVDLRGFGESLLLPTFPERARVVASAGAQLRITTNLSFNAPSALEVLAEVNARVSISLDVADDALLNHVRRGARLSRILDNVKFLRQAYSACGSDFRRVYVGATVLLSTIGHLTHLVEKSADLGITDLRLFARINNGELFASDAAARSTLLKDLDAAAKLAASRSVDLRIGTKLWPEMKDELPPYNFPCLRPWSYCVINWRGNIGYCDFLIGPGSEMQSFGNIMESDFDSIWNGERWRELRREHIDDDLARSTRFAHCGWCHHNRYVDFEDLTDTRYDPRILRPDEVVRWNTSHIDHE